MFYAKTMMGAMLISSDEESSNPMKGKKTQSEKLVGSKSGGGSELALKCLSTTVDLLAKLDNPPLSQ